MAEESGAPAAQPSGEPAEGQGQQDANQSPLDQWLNDVPLEHRDTLRPFAENIERNANKRFQEHAEYKKNWEPFEALGLGKDWTPEHVAQLLQFAELANDDDQFNQWLTGVAQERGLLGDQPGDETAPDELEQRLGALLEQRLGPLEQSLSAQQEQQRVQAAEQAIEGELAQVAQEHGELTEESRDAILKLAFAHGDEPNAVLKGAEDYYRIVGTAQSGLLDQKQRQPDTPVNGGQSSTRPDPILNFRDAKQAAMSRMGTRSAP